MNALGFELMYKPLLTTLRRLLFLLQSSMREKLPATSFDAKFFVEVVKNGEEPLLSETSHELADSSTGVLFPNLPSTFPASYTLTKSEYEDFNDGRVFLVVYSKVSYRDFFRTEHWTRNCVFIGLPGHAYAAKKCTDYSGIDDN